MINAKEISFEKLEMLVYGNYNIENDKVLFEFDFEFRSALPNEDPVNYMIKLL